MIIPNASNPTLLFIMRMVKNSNNILENWMPLKLKKLDRILVDLNFL